MTAGRRYSGTHSMVAALNARARRAGFAVSYRRCRRGVCGCQGIHWAIAGHGIRRNNLSGNDLADFFDEWKPDDDGARAS